MKLPEYFIRPLIRLKNNHRTAVRECVVCVYTEVERDDANFLKNSYDANTLVGEARILFDHLRCQAYFGASVFWVRKMAALGGEQSAIEDWQIKRDGNKRGLVEVIS